jgi:DNA polymerase-3 subunit gamma/tau
MSGLFQDASPTADALPDAPPPEGPGLFGDSPAQAGPAVTAAAATAATGPNAVAYRVLARKYRPTTFDELIGQEALVRTLRNAFALKRVAHAFMLTGVRGVGKTTTARIIARALTCIGPDGTGGPTADPCGVCANCTAILADRHPDVQEMDAASRTGVDDVREIIEATRFRPMQARTKVFIVDEVHMLSRNAFNALLKTLEEPPPHITFIFATTEIRKVPVTVLSRCQRFDLRRISAAELATLFGGFAVREGIEIEPEALAAIARAADGSARDGLSLLDQAIAQNTGGTITAAAVSDMLGLADRESTFDMFAALMAGKTADVLAVADRANSLGVDPGLMLQDLLELTHTLTRIKAVPSLRDSPELPEFERTRGAALAEALPMPALGRAWQMLLKGIAEVESAPDRRAAAEMVLIRLCYVADLPTPGDLVRRLTDPDASAGAGFPASALPDGGGASVRAPAGSNGGGRGVGGAATARAAPAPDSAPAPALAAAPAPQTDEPPAAPRLGSFRDVVAMISERREPTLHAHLVHSVHLVRFAPPVIELRPEPEAPRDLAARLAGLLMDATGARWTIALSAAPGEATLAQQGTAADTARRSAAADHPMVRAILDAFPGSRIEAVHDSRVDSFGLHAEAPPPLLDAPARYADPDPDAPDLEFAPDDAEFVEDLAELSPHDQE